MMYIVKNNANTKITGYAKAYRKQKECIILKRKVIATVMALICVMSFSACNSNKNTGTNDTGTTNGAINDAGDAVKDAGDAVSDAGNEVSSKAKDAMDDIKEDMSTNESTSAAN